MGDYVKELQDAGRNMEDLEKAAVEIQRHARGLNRRRQAAKDALERNEAETAGNLGFEPPPVGDTQGYLTRKQCEKISHDQIVEAKARIEEPESATMQRVEAGKHIPYSPMKKKPANPANDLPNLTARAQGLALAALSRIGWEGEEVMSTNPHAILAAKWRARRTILEYDSEQAATMLIAVTGLPQYKAAIIGSCVTGKRLLSLNINTLSMFGIKDHVHQRIYFAAVKAVQNYCDMDLEYVPATHHYPDVVASNLRLSSGRA